MHPGFDGGRGSDHPLALADDGGGGVRGVGDNPHHHFSQSYRTVDAPFASRIRRRSGATEHRHNTLYDDAYACSYSGTYLWEMERTMDQKRDPWSAQGPWPPGPVMPWASRDCSTGCQRSPMQTCTYTPKYSRGQPPLPNGPKYTWYVPLGSSRAGRRKYPDEISQK